ncbi:MAG: low molecular weight protein arginine phosphatase [Thermoplasmata archaeon]
MPGHKKVLFICTGNTCRSPMAKVILQQVLREHGIEDVLVDSAGVVDCSGCRAHDWARESIKERYGEDLLRTHVAKCIKNMDLAGFDLIITMEEAQKRHLPADRTFTLPELAGVQGDVGDLFGSPPNTYRVGRDRIEELVRKGLGRILSELGIDEKGRACDDRQR